MVSHSPLSAPLENKEAKFLAERGIDGIAFPLSAPLEYKEAKVLAERGIDGIAIPPLRTLGV